MSDLGVTVCEENAYPMASYMICSPHYLIVNTLFVISGMAYFVGGFIIHQFSRVPAAFRLWVVFSVGAVLSGLIPADIHFTAHTLPALAMFLVPIILAMYARRERAGKTLNWVFFSLLILCFIGMALTVFFPLIGGLLQRSFYVFVSIWGALFTLQLVRNEKQQL